MPQRSSPRTRRVDGGLHVGIPRLSDCREKFSSNIDSHKNGRASAFDMTFHKLFIEGLATRDLESALRALTGDEAPLIPSSI